MEGRHKELLDAALTQEAAAQEALLAGNDARALFTAAADLYRRSYEAAPPRSFGRLIGMLKATVLSGEGLERAADYAREHVAGADSPPSWYAAGIVALIDGDGERAREAAGHMRDATDAFARAADAMVAAADGDHDRLREVTAAIREDFAGREQHLTGVPIADTALMFEHLAGR